jgi:hypothetical protein
MMCFMMFESLMLWLQLLLVVHEHWHRSSASCQVGSKQWTRNILTSWGAATTDNTRATANRSAHSCAEHREYINVMLLIAKTLLTRAFLVTNAYSTLISCDTGINHLLMGIDIQYRPQQFCDLMPPLFPCSSYNNQEGCLKTVHDCSQAQRVLLLLLP